MIANFKIKSMRYLMALAMVLISLSPISCKKEKGGKNQNHGHDFQDKELKELEALEKKESDDR